MSDRGTINTKCFQSLDITHQLQISRSIKQIQASLFKKPHKPYNMKSFITVSLAIMALVAVHVQLSEQAEIGGDLISTLRITAKLCLCAKNKPSVPQDFFGCYEDPVRTLFTLQMLATYDFAFNPHVCVLQNSFILICSRRPSLSNANNKHSLERHWTIWTASSMPVLMPGNCQR